jgi:hypothetical protein
LDLEIHDLSLKLAFIVTAGESVELRPGGNCAEHRFFWSESKRWKALEILRIEPARYNILLGREVKTKIREEN